MPDHVLTEEPLQFGEGGRLLGILTVPSAQPRIAGDLPAFVFLTAGTLHRVGPARLHARLARELAKLGFHSLRVDLSGTGDSPPRSGLTNQQSVAADYKEIVSVLDTRLGRVPLVLAGLCSGADNAIRLTPTDPRIVGIVLLDPFCYPDAGFATRAALQKYANPSRYIAAVKRRISHMKMPMEEKALHIESAEYWTIRDLPTREQMQAAFAALKARNGRALSVLTQYARPYYNQAGQLERIVGVDGYRLFCTELFWPRVEHTFPLEFHRLRLMEEIRSWARGYLPVKEAPERAAITVGPDLAECGS